MILDLNKKANKIALDITSFASVFKLVNTKCTETISFSYHQF